MNDLDRKLVTIGIFYDGNYLYHVSNYYNYFHERKSRISIAGLHHFVRAKISEIEGDTSGSINNCQIVDAHYFKGRLSAKEASLKENKLYYDRVFEDVLIEEGISTHYIPMKGIHGGKEEKGIDVWLALEAYELTVHKQFDVVVLVVSDGDYVPLIKKLNSLGTRVMLLYWDFEYTDDFGNRRVTRTSQELIEKVTYPVSMNDSIDNRLGKDKQLVNSLFVQAAMKTERVYSVPDLQNDDIKISEVLSIKDGYGFIKFPPNNLFFHYSKVYGTDFNDLLPGDRVQFKLDKNDIGEDIAIDVELITD